jgi:hypothetical protein
MRETKGKTIAGTLMDEDIMLIVILLVLAIGDGGRPKGASIDVTWGGRLIITTRGTRHILSIFLTIAIMTNDLRSHGRSHFPPVIPHSALLLGRRAQMSRKGAQKLQVLATALCEKQSLSKFRKPLKVPSDNSLAQLESSFAHSSDPSPDHGSLCSANVRDRTSTVS